MSAATKRLLQKAARRAYGGSVSALIEAIALDVERQNAFEELLREAPPIDEKEYAAFLAEMYALPKPAKRTRATKKRHRRAA